MSNSHPSSVSSTFANREGIVDNNPDVRTCLYLSRSLFLQMLNLRSQRAILLPQRLVLRGQGTILIHELRELGLSE